MGSSTFGLPAVKALFKKHNIISIYTKAEKPAGRGMQSQKTPIHEFAIEHSIPVYTPTTLKTDTEINTLKKQKPDVIIVAAYGLILPQAILDIPTLGCINIHGSLLPHWRGAAPIHHALLAGDTVMGVTIMQMDAGMDTGPILAKTELPKSTILQSFNFIHDAMAELGANTLVHVLDHLKSITPKEQDDSQATYAPKITKEDTLINSNMTVQKILNVVHTFGDSTGARFEHNKNLFSIHSAQSLDYTCTATSFSKTTDNKLIYPSSDGCIEILTIQRSGKRIVTAKEFLNGFRF